MPVFLIPRRPVLILPIIPDDIPFLEQLALDVMLVFPRHNWHMRSSASTETRRLSVEVPLL